VKRSLLLHEIAFGSFLVITWGRIIFVSGLFDPHSILFGGLTVAAIVLVVVTSRQPTELLWRIRLVFYPVAMNLSFFALKGVVPLIMPHKIDRALQAIDRALIGTSSSLLIEPFIHPLLTEILSICYLLFFPYIVIAFLRYLRRPLETAKKFYAGIFTVYGIGFLSYTFFPAGGPYLAMDGQFSSSLSGWWFTNWNDSIVRMGSNGADVFPSLHCGISAFILLFDRTHTPRRFATALPFCIGLWISTVYLRYHYLIDLVVGFSLTFCTLWLIGHLDRKGAFDGVSS